MRTPARSRRTKTVECYRVVQADEASLMYCDRGDETLLGRYVERLLREGATGLVIDRVGMTLAEADAIPTEKLVG